MKALLVYPEWPDTYWSFKHALPFEGKRSVFPPLGLLTVASMLPKTWEQRLVDINIRPVTDADLKWADVVMISAMLVQKDGMLRTLARCRELGRRTVVGGPISSCMTDLALYADHVVVGEAEELVEGLAADLEQGTAKPLYQARELPGLNTTPLPKLDLINPKYYSAMAIQYSRGCPFNCEFCDIIEIYGRKPRTKSPDQMVAELEHLYARKWRGPIFIVDDNFIGNKRKVKELLPVMAQWNAQHGRPFTFYTEASVNLADDEDLLQMMQDASFDRVFLGIETPAEESLKEAQKMQNTRRSLLDSVRRIQRYGMEVMAGFIVGFDNDPEDIFDRQVAFHPGKRDSAGHGRPAASHSRHATLSPPAKRRPHRVRRQREQSRFSSEFSASDGPSAPAGGLSLHPAAHLPSRHLLRASAQISGSIPAAHQPQTVDALRLPGPGAIHSQTGNFQPARFLVLAAFHSGQHALPAILRRRDPPGDHGLPFPEAHGNHPEPRVNRGAAAFPQLQSPSRPPS